MCSAAPVEFKVRASCAALVDHAMASGAWLMAPGDSCLHILAAESEDDDLKPILSNPGLNELLMRRIRLVGAKAEKSFEPVIVRNFDALGIFRDFVAVPLVLSGGVSGSLCCMFRSDAHRQDEELQAIEVVARIVAMSLQASGVLGRPGFASAQNIELADKAKMANERELMALAARMDPLIRTLPGAVVVIQPDGALVESIPGSPASTQLPMRKAPGHGWSFNFASEHASHLHEAAIKKAFRGETSSCVFYVKDWTGSKDSRRIIEQTFNPVMGVDGEIVEVVGFTQDVTQREQMAETLRQLREKDSITDCMTMHALREHAEHEIASYSFNGMVMGFCSIEIDKSGAGVHLLGPTSFEEMLQTVVARIRRQLPRIHVLARRGDHSFVAFSRLDLPELKEGDDVAAIAQKINHRSAGRIVQTLSEPIVTGRHEYFIGVNVGHCVYPFDGSTVDEILYNCDIAAMTAGSQRRNLALAYDSSMATEANERVRIETALHRAVDHEEFALAYQPKVRLVDGSISGVEALIRWPGRAPISPAKFIPIAEECGLIAFIGEWALRHACKTAATWAAAGKRIPISVNVSTRQFHDDEFHEIVAEILHETACPAEMLELEVTEGVMIRDIDKVIASFRKLREMGVKLSIDDFGTGFSSLAYLKNLPVNTLKIDRAFVHNLPKSAENEAITKAILAMADALGLRTVAEGVEELDCLKHLRILGCDEVQGFYFSQPLMERDFMDWYTAYESVRSARLSDRIAASQTLPLVEGN